MTGKRKVVALIGTNRLVKRKGVSKMSRNSFNKWNRVVSRHVFGASITFTLLACVQMLAPSALAGGFQLSVETPSSTVNNQTKDAVLIVRTFGCHQPADAKLNATAEGLVSGGRKSVPIEMSSIGSG